VYLPSQTPSWLLGLSFAVLRRSFIQTALAIQSLYPHQYSLATAFTFLVMTRPSTQMDTTELVKQLLERLAMSSAHEGHAAAISTLTADHSQTRKAVQELEASYDKFTAQQIVIPNKNNRFFEDVQRQLSAMQFEIMGLQNEKEELRATVRYV
jgi:hypothetical protein